MEPTNDGHSLVMSTKMVVSPMAGVFEPRQLAGHRISVGQVIGHVASASERVPIKSPFEGIVDVVTAWPAERVRKYQMLMALETPNPGVA